MGNRHKVEQYYSIRVETKNGDVVIIDTSKWNGSFANLTELINTQTKQQWQKVRAFKYTQNIDIRKNAGSCIVGKKRSLLKVDRIGSGSLCTKVNENFMRDGVFPQNVLAFFGEQNGK